MNKVLMLIGIVAVVAIIAFFTVGIPGKNAEAAFKKFDVNSSGDLYSEIYFLSDEQANSLKAELLGVQGIGASEKEKKSAELALKLIELRDLSKQMDESESKFNLGFFSDGKCASVGYLEELISVQEEYLAKIKESESLSTQSGLKIDSLNYNVTEKVINENKEYLERLNSECE